MGENLQEAQKAIQKAQQYYSNGNIEKAIKFVEKSLRLYPSDAAKHLLARYRLAEQKFRSVPPTPSPKQTPLPANANYTQQQVNAVRAVLNKKNYYNLLGVPQNANPDMLKKAYRKLALKFHPDKNQAPGAEDAFKAIQAAHQCLTDPQKRRYYDQYGEEETQRPRRTRRGFHEHDMEDFFFNFFGFQQGGRRRRPAGDQQQQQGQQRQGGIMQFAHLLPLLLLFLFSILSGTTHDDSPFKLEKTDSYHSQRRTPNGAVYFVSSSFGRRYKHDYRGMAQVESLVNEQYYDKLHAACKSERLERSRSIADAQQVRGHSQFSGLKNAYSMKMPSCVNLRDLVSSYG